MPFKWLTSCSSYFDNEKMWVDTLTTFHLDDFLYWFPVSRSWRLWAILERWRSGAEGPLEVTLPPAGSRLARHCPSTPGCIMKEWKRSTKVKYRREWECPGCCGGTLEEVVMMTALTQCRCSKAWQVGQLPRTHYFSPETNLVMCWVTSVKDWPTVNRGISLFT